MLAQIQALQDILTRSSIKLGRTNISSTKRYLKIKEKKEPRILISLSEATDRAGLGCWAKLLLLPCAFQWFRGKWKALLGFACLSGHKNIHNACASGETQPVKCLPTSLLLLVTERRGKADWNTSCVPFVTSSPRHHQRRDESSPASTFLTLNSSEWILTKFHKQHPSCRNRLHAICCHTLKVASVGSIKVSYSQSRPIACCTKR